MDRDNNPIRNLSGAERPDSGLNLHGVRRAFRPTVVNNESIKTLCDEVGLTDNHLSKYFKQNLDYYRNFTEEDATTLGTKRLLAKNFDNANSQSIEAPGSARREKGFFSAKG